MQKIEEGKKMSEPTMVPVAISEGSDGKFFATVVVKGKQHSWDVTPILMDVPEGEFWPQEMFKEAQELAQMLSHAIFYEEEGGHKHFDSIVQRTEKTSPITGTCIYHEGRWGSFRGVISTKLCLLTGCDLKWGKA